MAGSEPQPLADELTIGEAAARIGIATSALRFYEDKGLIQSRRTDGGQRRYARDVLRRVAFIRAAQSVGLSLTEIAAGLSTLPADRAPNRAEWGPPPRARVLDTSSGTEQHVNRRQRGRSGPTEAGTAHPAPV